MRAAALVPIPGYPHLTLAACPDCHLGFGLASHPAVTWAIRRHQRTCPAGQPCPKCWCEAELVERDGSLRCADCWADLLEVAAG